MRNLSYLGLEIKVGFTGVAATLVHSPACIIATLSFRRGVHIAVLYFAGHLPQLR
jgi:hypothetical protein